MSLQSIPIDKQDELHLKLSELAAMTGVLRAAASGEYSSDNVNLWGYAIMLHDKAQEAKALFSEMTSKETKEEAA